MNTGMHFGFLSARFFPARAKIMVSLAGMAALALTVSAQGSGPAQDIWVEARLNTTVAYVGQTFHYLISAGIKNGSVRLPGGKVIWPGCRLLSYAEKDVSDRHEGYQARQGQYALMALGLEAIEFPPLEVEFAWPEGTTLSARGEVLKLTMASRNPQGLSLRPQRGPRAAPNFGPFLWLLLLPLPVGLSWYFLKQLRRRSGKTRPAHWIAYQKLEALGRSHAVREGRVDEYFGALSRLLRQYAAARFGWTVSEVPRGEIMEALKREGVPPRIRRWFNYILIQADWVKFAKSWVEFSEIAAAQRRARQFIDATRPLELPKGVRKRQKRMKA